MYDDIIIHRFQANIEDYLYDYEDKNKYKCKSCLFVGATKKLDYVCTNSLSLYYELDVFKCEGCIFYKKESLEYENEDGGLFND